MPEGVELNYPVLKIDFSRFDLPVVVTDVAMLPEQIRISAECDIPELYSLFTRKSPINSI